MTQGDLTAIGRFVVLFALMLLRVRIGVALGLGGLGGFAAVRGVGPALILLATSPARGGPISTSRWRRSSSCWASLRPTRA